MGNINDEITDLLLELNQYCFDKHIDLEIEMGDDTVKNSIRRQKNGDIHVVLGEYDDNKFLNRLTKFIIKLKSSATV